MMSGQGGSRTALTASHGLAMLDLDLIIYDLDGTLLDTRVDIANAANHALAALGRPERSVDELTTFVGQGVTNLLIRALDSEDPELLAAGRAAFHSYYRDHLLVHSTLYPGVRETLAALSRLNACVLSNKPHPYTTAIIDAIGFSGHFREVLGSENGLALKPAPDALHYLLERHGTDPGRAAIVGDTGNDILAGQAAGIHTVAALYGFRSAEELRGYTPDFTIERFSDLIALLS